MITRGLLAAVGTAYCGWLPVSATSVGTELICQPTYLGSASRPDRIPLSPVIYNANHGYGSHSVIFESRPCFHGHFITDTRPEYEQNLAVLFGISCKLSDETQMVGCVATFSVRKALPPKNAPYTQEQVLAASLQTLLMHSHHMSKARPLTVEIKGDGIPQPKWAAKYAKRYFYTDDELASDRKGEILLKPLPVPGIRIDDTSTPGAIYLVFEGEKSDPKITVANPVFVPFMPEGEGDSGMIYLVPMWPGNSWSEPLGVLTRPDLPYYEKWGSGDGTFGEHDAKPNQSASNPMFDSGSLTVIEKESSSIVRIANGEATPEQFATFVFCCLATVRPTVARPLELTVSNVALGDEYLKRLSKNPEWKDGISCRFALDPKSMKLLGGSVPGYHMEWDGWRIRVATSLPDPDETGEKPH
ncbi:MAG: hypothetical protein J0M04_12180 [Verrucomicrobia bacterium]|nr:hypothetical protein [Verrucomicrobiota bacterium]